MVDRPIILSAVGVITLALLLGGCSAWQPVSETERIEATRSPAEEPGVRIEAVVSIRSAELTGDFRCVLAADRCSDPRVRIQLYPDLGGKILDLVATDQSLRGFVVDQTLRLDTATGSAPPREFLTFLALTLLEWHRPLGADSLIGRRDGPRGRWYRLKTGWPPHEIHQLGTERDAERHHYYRGVRWVETHGSEPPTHHIVARDFELSILIEEFDTEALLPDFLFELTLPVTSVTAPEAAATATSNADSAKTDSAKTASSKTSS